MRRTYAGIFLTALATLLLELLLIRTFDVILNPNMGWMVITCALFSFGVAGIYGTLRPPPRGPAANKQLARLALLFAATTVLLLPAINWLPFEGPDRLLVAPVEQVIAFGGLYLVLVVPFFFSGRIFMTLFSAYSARIQSLYFWDLVGAGIGCVILVPFLPRIGPAGLLFFVAGAGVVASGLFSGSRSRQLASLIAGMVIAALPFAQSSQRVHFTEHLGKRGVKQARLEGRVEFTRWDPISKIDVVRLPEEDRKHIAYDGGGQSSYFYKFDGDLDALRRGIESGDIDVEQHFWFGGVLASHYLKRDQGHSALIIGSAGGQETVAALMYGAGRVDAVEMVGTVVELGKGRYAGYTGNIFNHPNVNELVGEGRSYLRTSDRKYDVIQMFSNHTSSSIAQGTGAIAPSYLQTVEAYVEYFRHLTDNGILQINHHVYPRMITAAAEAWRSLGRSEFQKHVVVFERPRRVDYLPTLLIKMDRWTPEEIEMLEFIASLGSGSAGGRMVENPLRPELSFLSPDFYSGNLPDSIADRMLFRVTPATDDLPYYNYLRKTIAEVEANSRTFLNSSTAGLLNAQVRRSVPMDLIWLVLVGVASMFFAVCFIVVPMFFSRVGRISWPGKPGVLLYFSCLGAGFIIIELVLIQMFMQLVGFPIYAYTVVLFTMLVAAGLGSLSSSKLRISPSRRWTWPFLGVALTGLALLMARPHLFHLFLASPIEWRIAVASSMVFPLGFFLGMPFPLGILLIERMPSGAVAWAWAMNGLFTVVGGLLSVILSMHIGFQRSLLVALGFYGLAVAAFYAVKRTTIQHVDGAGQPEADVELRQMA
ncbi:MAG: hypothetical protein P8X82_09160 [Gemmatimonadales bacterium]